MTVIRLRAGSLFWRESGGEVVALDAETSRYFAANPSAVALWRRLDEGATEADLVDALRERYELSREVAEADVRAFVEQLAARGLLEPS
jgi:hypothetical protein